MAANSYSLQFNGSSQYGTNQSVSGIFGTARYTVEAWFKYNGTGGSGRIICTGSRAASGEVHSNIYISSNKIYAYLGINGADASHAANTTLSSGTWYHGAVVYNGTDVRIYYGTATADDVLDNTPAARTGNMNTPGHNAIHIGCGCITSKTDRGDWYSGYSDEIRIWGIDRSLAEINANRKKRLTGSEPNLLGLWRMYEGTGTSVDDESSKNHNLTLGGSPTWSTDVPFPSYAGDSGGLMMMAV